MTDNLSLIVKFSLTPSLCSISMVIRKQLNKDIDSLINSLSLKRCQMKRNKRCGSVEGLVDGPRKIWSPCKSSSLFKKMEWEA